MQEKKQAFISRWRKAMLDINDYSEVKECTYKEERYLVRDNGAVLRKSREGKKKRKLDDEWSFGKVNEKGYMVFGGERVHRIVATAFLGEPPTENHVLVDHIDTNRQNNRPKNLRWVTKVENAVLNPVTRKKIEYITGVDVFEFLANPSKYRDLFVADANLGWMRQVTEEEGAACLENVTRWAEENKQTQNPGSGVGGWIYHLTTPKTQNKGELIESLTLNAKQRDWRTSERFLCCPEIIKGELIESLTLNAKQRDWRTPERFLCCPEIIEGDPIECYYSRLQEGREFSASKYGTSFTEKCAVVGENEAIVVITAIPSPIKPFALAKITYENGCYVHQGLGTFFSETGAEKRFTLAQGLEWTGEDSIDDYC